MHVASCHWVTRLTSLVECWNSLDGKTVELTSWVQGSDSSQVADNSGISIEKLETQLILLKATFKEKESMLESLKTRWHLSLFLHTVRCGPNSDYPTLDTLAPTQGDPNPPTAFPRGGSGGGLLHLRRKLRRTNQPRG